MSDIAIPQLIMVLIVWQHIDTKDIYARSITQENYSHLQNHVSYV